MDGCDKDCSELGIAPNIELASENIVNQKGGNDEPITDKQQGGKRGDREEQGEEASTSRIPPVVPMKLLPTAGSLPPRPSPELQRLAGSKKATEVLGAPKAEGQLLKKAARLKGFWNKRYFVFESDSRLLKWYHDSRGVVPKRTGTVKRVFEIPTRRGAYKWRIDVLLLMQQEELMVSIAAASAGEKDYWLDAFRNAGFPPADLPLHPRFEIFKRGMVRPSSQVNLKGLGPQDLFVSSSSVDGNAFEAELDGGAYACPIGSRGASYLLFACLVRCVWCARRWPR
jgi:hypothetical protein